MRNIVQDILFVLILYLRYSLSLIMIFFIMNFLILLKYTTSSYSMVLFSYRIFCFYHQKFIKNSLYFTSFTKFFKNFLRKIIFQEKVSEFFLKKVRWQAKIGHVVTTLLSIQTFN